MATHNDLGKNGERIAAEYLEREGYRIVGRNYSYRKAEIDLLAIKDDTLAAVEVKTRSGTKVGRPQDFVTSGKIGLMVMAVNEFVRVHKIDCEVRLDIIAIRKTGTGYAIEHFKDAVYHF